MLGGEGIFLIQPLVSSNSLFDLNKSVKSLESKVEKCLQGKCFLMIPKSQCLVVGAVNLLIARG